MADEENEKNESKLKRIIIIFNKTKIKGYKN
jgi:hypothetical protein